jgi:hypothetical protein
MLSRASAVLVAVVALSTVLISQPPLTLDQQSPAEVPPSLVNPFVGGAFNPEGEPHALWPDQRP